MDRRMVARAESGDVLQETYLDAVQQIGSSPELVARHIESQLRRRRLPVRSIAGKAMEKLGVIGKRLMTSRQFEAVMALTYAPGRTPEKAD